MDRDDWPLYGILVLLLLMIFGIGVVGASLDYFVQKNEYELNKTCIENGGNWLITTSGRGECRIG